MSTVSAGSCSAACKTSRTIVASRPGSNMSDRLGTCTSRRRTRFGTSGTPSARTPGAGGTGSSIVSGTTSCSASRTRANGRSFPRSTRTRTSNGLSRWPTARSLRSRKKHTAIERRPPRSSSKPQANRPPCTARRPIRAFDAGRIVSVQGPRFLGDLDDPNATALRRELGEIGHRFERDFWGHNTRSLRPALDHPLGGNRWRDAGVHDASSDVPFLVGPSHRLVAERDGIPLAFADQDAPLDVHVELRFLRLRETVDDGRGHIIRADLRSLHHDLIAARKAETDDRLDRLPERRGEGDDEVHFLDTLSDRLRHGDKLRMDRVVALHDAHGRHELGPLQPGERGDELDLSFPQDRGVHRELVEDRPDGIRGNEDSRLATRYHRAAAAEEDLVDLVEFARTVGAHHVHRPGRGADAEDARHAGVLRSSVELQLSQRLVVQAAEVAIMNPRLDSRLHDRDVQIVPGAVNHAVPVFHFADEGRGIACIDGDRHGPWIPLGSSERLGFRLTPARDADPVAARTRQEIGDRGLRHRAVSAEDEHVQGTPGSPEDRSSLILFARPIPSSICERGRRTSPGYFCLLRLVFPHENGSEFSESRPSISYITKGSFTRPWDVCGRISSSGPRPSPRSSFPSPFSSVISQPLHRRTPCGSASSPT